MSHRVRLPSPHLQLNSSELRLPVTSASCLPLLRRANERIDFPILDHNSYFRDKRLLFVVIKSASWWTAGDGWVEGQTALGQSWVRGNQRWISTRFSTGCRTWDQPVLSGFQFPICDMQSVVLGLRFQKKSFKSGRMF